MNDDPIGRHLEARAAAITLPRTNVAVIAERASSRRQRRRRVTYGIAGVTLLAGTTFAFVLTDGGDEETPVATTPDAVVDSPLEWTVVEPSSGLAYARTTVAADGAIYSLSTAPGPATLDDPAGFANRTVYRSADGAEWDALDLPDDLYTTGLAAEGSRLYAVGTGPTGGEGVPLRLSTSDDGGATWAETIELPGDVAELKTQFGREISVGIPTVAAHGGTTLVAVTVTAYPDVPSRAPGSLDTSFGYEMGPEGVAIYGEPPCAAERRVCEGEPPVAATLTWEQLEVPEELQAFLRPRMYLYAASADGAFERIQGPIDEAAHLTQLGADGSGFTLIANEVPDGPGDAGSNRTRLFTSADGRTWTEGPNLPGVYIEDLAPAGDVTMASGWATNGGAVLGTIGADGFDPIDPHDALDPAVAPSFAQTTSGFGPLGWASLLVEQVESRTPPAFVVHSDRAGTAMSAVAIPEELTTFGTPTGVIVTADAIVVRFTEFADGDPRTVERQRLWVGTPAG